MEHDKNLFQTNVIYLFRLFYRCVFNNNHTCSYVNLTNLILVLNFNVIIISTILITF